MWNRKAVCHPEAAVVRPTPGSHRTTDPRSAPASVCSDRSQQDCSGAAGGEIRGQRRAHQQNGEEHVVDEALELDPELRGAPGEPAEQYAEVG